MKQRKLELDKIVTYNNLKSIIIPFSFGIIMLFTSCERNSIEKINTITSKLNAPSIAVTNTQIIYSKNAKIQVKINSKQINRYIDIEKPYTEFPEGLFVEFYDSTQNVNSSIKANYCIYDQTTEIWTAENDVVVVGEDGNTLNTEYLTWDQQKGKIYSDRYVRMTTQDGDIIHGKGFEANQDLSNWKIKNISGNIIVNDEK